MHYNPNNIHRQLGEYTRMPGFLYLLSCKITNEFVIIGYIQIYRDVIQYFSIAPGCILFTTVVYICCFDAMMCLPSSQNVQNDSYLEIPIYNASVLWYNMFLK